jgi:hypothetical protein
LFSSLLQPRSLTLTSRGGGGSSMLHALNLGFLFLAPIGLGKNSASGSCRNSLLLPILNLFLHQYRYARTSLDGTLHCSKISFHDSLSTVLCQSTVESVYCVTRECVSNHTKNIVIQLSSVQLSSAGFSRHPTATAGPISQGGISGHKQEAGLPPHTRPSLLLERYKCTAGTAELAKIAQNRRASGCTHTKYSIVSILVPRSS